MKFYNEKGDYLELTIKDYEFPDLEPHEYEEYDANWLDITIKAKDDKYQWQYTYPCLLTWEAKYLLDLLRAVTEDREYGKLYFESPELSLSAQDHKDDNKCLLRWGLWLDLHPFSFEDDVEPYIMSFAMTREDLAKEVDNFAFELKGFPRR